MAMAVRPRPRRGGERLGVLFTLMLTVVSVIVLSNSVPSRRERSIGAGTPHSYANVTDSAMQGSRVEWGSTGNPPSVFASTCVNTEEMRSGRSPSLLVDSMQERVEGESVRESVQDLVDSQHGRARALNAREDDGYGPSREESRSGRRYRRRDELRQRRREDYSRDRYGHREGRRLRDFSEEALTQPGDLDDESQSRWSLGASPLNPLTSSTHVNPESVTSRATRYEGGDKVKIRNLDKIIELGELPEDQIWDGWSREHLVYGVETIVDKERKAKGLPPAPQYRRKGRGRFCCDPTTGLPKPDSLYTEKWVWPEHWDREKKRYFSEMFFAEAQKISEAEFRMLIRDVRAKLKPEISEKISDRQILDMVFAQKKPGGSTYNPPSLEPPSGSANVTLTTRATNDVRFPDQLGVDREELHRNLEQRLAETSLHSLPHTPKDAQSQVTDNSAILR